MSSISSKKRTKTSITVVKLNSFVRFLEEIEDTKNLFEIIRPLLAKEIHYSILHKSLFQLFCLMCGSPYIKFQNFSTYRLTTFKIK